MRDPWLPIAWLLLVVLTIWLGVAGPLPNGVTGWIRDWQSLIAASVALFAAFIAYKNTTRVMQHNEELKKKEQDRKHAAARAVLPLALSQVIEYVQRSAEALDDLINKTQKDTLPAQSVSPGVHAASSIRNIRAFFSVY
jgi:type VI protein secretion system component VasK